MQLSISAYQRIGEDKIREIIKHFYQEIKTDEILRPMYPEGDLAAAEERLFLFVIQVLGGPTTYTEKRGKPLLRQRHIKFPIDEKAKDNWLNNMKIAMSKVKLDAEDEKYLWNYFVKTANFMINK